MQEEHEKRDANTGASPAAEGAVKADRKELLRRIEERKERCRRAYDNWYAHERDLMRAKMELERFNEEQPGPAAPPIWLNKIATPRGM